MGQGLHDFMLSCDVYASRSNPCFSFATRGNFASQACHFAPAILTFRTPDARGSLSVGQQHGGSGSGNPLAAVCATHRSGRGFPVIKSELHLRPIWHRIDRRVEAHVMVAFLGYCPWVCMKQKPRRVPCSITPARALESLAGILMVEVWFTLCGGRHLCLARISGVGTGATAVTASLAAAVAGGRRRSSHHPFCRFGIDFGRIREVETTKNRQKPLKIKGKGRLRQFQWISSMGSVACQPRNRAWPTGSWSCGSLARRGRIRGREVCLKRTHQRSRSTRKWPPGNGLRSARWRRYSIAAAAGFTSSPARRKTSRLPSGSFKLGADFSYLLARTPRASITSNCKPGGTTCVG